ncbi:hypothetical protein [Cupriavidus basilensis]|uniref:hypothetical protein n=1 Tax=Cupriavidus basilensis TaxID=68895 RepID=UPI0023E80537|nr:hypothetical protein [Cupriavidus basilensis]MDF3887407.1 hypothetical protein [Cupriavidus basilensis]
MTALDVARFESEMIRTFAWFRPLCFPSIRREKQFRTGKGKFFVEARLSSRRRRFLQFRNIVAQHIFLQTSGTAGVAREATAQRIAKRISQRPRSLKTPLARDHSANKLIGH